MDNQKSTNFDAQASVSWQTVEKIVTAGASKSGTNNQKWNQITSKRQRRSNPSGDQ